MLNYPFPSPPVLYSSYKFDLNLQIINKVLFQTVFIGYKTDKTLNFVCYGVLFPVLSALTTFIGYKCCRVAWIKHVRKLETTFVCYAFIEAMLMQLISTSFTLFYWTWGAVEYEEDLGTSKFVCVYYLYCFNYLPLFCYNLINCTISCLLIAYYRKRHSHMCGIKLNNFNIRTFYVVLLNLALCDVLFIFCISWIAMAKTEEVKNYQTKCFVLLNPLFQRFKIVDLIKGLEWQTQIFVHSIPYFFCICYMLLVLFTMFRDSMRRRKGDGIQLREKQHYGGSAFTLTFTTVFMIIDSIFNLFCDAYEISLHYSKGPTNAEFFFMLKNCKTVMRTMYCFIAPFQLLALCSLSPQFQSTMVRYLNGTTKFEVLTQKTIGGETRTTVLYEPLPKPSELKWLAWLYFKWCRCYFTVWIFQRFLDHIEDAVRSRRQRRRQRKMDREIAKENKRREQQLKATPPAEKITPLSIKVTPSSKKTTPPVKEARIQIEEPDIEVESTERSSLVSRPAFRVVESTV